MFPNHKPHSKWQKLVNFFLGNLIPTNNMMAPIIAQKYAPKSKGFIMGCARSVTVIKIQAPTRTNINILLLLSYKRSMYSLGVVVGPVLAVELYGIRNGSQFYATGAILLLGGLNFTRVFREIGADGGS
jgi:hypothetical protein